MSAASTGRSALPANVAGLDFLPLARTVALQARRLRGRGAKVVIAVAHEGGECTSFTDADSLDSCDAKSEIFSVVRALPKGSGAAHGYFGATPAVDGSDAWDTPLGRTTIDESLRQALLDSGTAVLDSSAHRHEHSIEVQVPFIQHMFPDARIVPIIVPPNESAMPLGEALAETCRFRRTVVAIGSTDLTHYGPRYGFTPMGVGAEALHWASEVNDRQFIDLALALEPARLLANALENGNACGPGAAAAVVAAAQRLGAKKGVLLAHTNSNEVMLREMGTASRDSVGYAAIVF